MPPDTLATGICHSSDAPAEASSTASAAAAASTGSSNSTGSAQPTGNGTTSSSSPKATGADFEGAAASSFGMSIAAIALGGVAFMI